MADITVDEDTYEDMRQAVYDANSKLRAEQREHDITRRQRDTLQTQCEDMQSEMETDRKTNNAALKPSECVDNQAVVDIVVEKDDKISILMQRVAHADERLETANAMATTYADANASLKRELATTTQRLDNSLNITDEMVSTDMKGASIESRHALWKHLEVRFGYRVRVDWPGSRQLCCRQLVEEQRLWLQYNYVEVLGL